MNDAQLVALVVAVPFVLAVLIGWCCRPRCSRRSPHRGRRRR
jgi:hypothetical protein